MIEKSLMPSVGYLFAMLQLHVPCLVFTYRACVMPFNTIFTQILICWKVIKGTKYHCTQLEYLLQIPIKHVNPFLP